MKIVVLDKENYFILDSLHEIEGTIVFVTFCWLPSTLNVKFKVKVWAKTRIKYETFKCGVKQGL